MPAILEKVLRFGEGRIVKKLSGLAQQVNVLESDFESLSDAELREETDRFKARLADGATLDELLPEAFAAVREASRRTLGQRHFDVQLMGGAALHLGNIAEMTTGEGKTLVATAPRTSTRSRARACTSSRSTTTWRATRPSSWAACTGSWV